MSPLIMSLVYLVVCLFIAGLLLWAVQQFPIDATFQRLIRVVVIVVAALLCLRFLLMAFGVAVPG